MNKYLLGIDVGTSAVKAACFNENFRMAACESADYPIYFCGENRVEQDPEEWWDATVRVISRISEVIKGDGEIAAVSVSSQSPALLPLDRDGKTIRRAMIWMDRRAQAESDYAAYDLIGYERYKKILRSEPDAYYVLPKVLWYMKNEPENYERTAMFLQVNGYINYRLTGEYSLDLIHAVSSQGMDYDKRSWSDEIAELTGIPFSRLFPRISLPYEIIGKVTKKAAELTGLAEGTPVVAGVTDTIASYYGCGALSERSSAEMSGTSSIMFFNISKTLDDYGKMMVKPSMFDRNSNIIVAAINSSGGSVEWFRNLFSSGNNPPLDYDQFNREAAMAEPGSGKVIWFPYLSGERSPLFCSYARGMYIGINSNTGRAQLARAVLEGTSYAIRHNFDEARRLGAAPEYIAACGGGVKSQLWLKIKASVLGIPLKVFENETVDRATLGDAILAGYGIGLVDDVVARSQQVCRFSKVVEPDSGWARIYDDFYALYRKMYVHLEDDLKELSLVQATYKGGKK